MSVVMYLIEWYHIPENCNPKIHCSEYPIFTYDYWLGVSDIVDISAWLINVQQYYGFNG
jgi:hypothetical protein